MKSLLFLSVLIILNGCSRSEDNPITTRIDYGKVIKIGSCHSGKYSYKCDITTTKYFFNDLDVTNYPSEQINIGDNLFREEVKTENKITSKRCKNNSCMSSVICHWWMPCYK